MKKLTWLAALGACAGSAWGQEQTLRNDALINGSTAAIQMGFEDFEIAGARFVIPNSMFPLQLKRVQIFWKSFFGQSINGVQESINIYRHDGAIPQLVLESDPPQLTDGFLNEFNFESENLVFETPGLITVGLVFAADAAPAANGVMRGFNYASVVTDTNGCQPGFNPIYAIPGGWTDICAFGARGDLVIRIVVEHIEPPACVPDLNGDGAVDFNDYLEFLNLFNLRDPRVDYNNDGTIDFNDYLEYLNLFNAGC